MDMAKKKTKDRGHAPAKPKTEEEPTIREVRYTAPPIDEQNRLMVAEWILRDGSRRWTPYRPGTERYEAREHVAELLRLYSNNPMDSSDDKVRAYLDEHRGEVPIRLVKRAAAGLNRIAQSHDPNQLPNQTWRELAEVLEEWIANGGKNTTTKAKADKEWEDLKALALFHAYRFEAGDKTAGITNKNREQVASDAGFTAKSSGKTLMRHFQRYAYRPNRVAERTKEGGRPGDVEKRMRTVIEKLVDYPEALAKAEDESKIVRARSSWEED